MLVGLLSPTVQAPPSPQYRTFLNGLGRDLPTCRSQSLHQSGFGAPHSSSLLYIAVHSTDSTVTARSCCGDATQCNRCSPRMEDQQVMSMLLFHRQHPPSARLIWRFFPQLPVRPTRLGEGVLISPISLVSRQSSAAEHRTHSGARAHGGDGSSRPPAAPPCARRGRSNQSKRAERPQ